MVRKYKRYIPLKTTCCKCEELVKPEDRRKNRYCPRCWAGYMRTYRSKLKAAKQEIK